MPSLSAVSAAAVSAFGGPPIYIGAVTFVGTGTFSAVQAEAAIGFSGTGAFLPIATMIMNSDQLNYVSFGTFFVEGIGDNPGYGNELRDCDEDFIDPITVINAGTSLTKRPDAIAFDYLTAFSMGPKAISDVTEGVSFKPWYVRCDNVTKTVYIAAQNSAGTAWLVENILFQFTGSDIEEIDLAFEQAARAVVCAERTVSGTKEVWLYWFKPAASAFVFEKITNGRTPRVVLDDVEDTSGSDIQLMYFKSGVGLARREQRELYAVEHTTPVAYSDDYYLEELALTKSRRLAAIYSFRDVAVCHWFLFTLQSALYPVYPDDTFTGSADVLSGTMVVVVIFHTLYDKDTFTSTADILAAGSALAVAVIVHSLYDKDTFTSTADILAAGSSFIVLIIEHSLYDKDTFTSTVDILATSTFLVVVIVHSLYDKDTFTSTADILASGSALEVP